MSGEIYRHGFRRGFFWGAILTIQLVFMLRASASWLKGWGLWPV